MINRGIFRGKQVRDSFQRCSEVSYRVASLLLSVGDNKIEQFYLSVEKHIYKSNLIFCFLFKCEMVINSLYV